ncbi:MAG: hypothetical protein JL50_02090 [Peptococcaceae bacterium BICA1-7]|nr:MAG: hypothetical protein JL50_02090 [Peptococcaceae bacterium BICA1-7]HBV96260.1 S-layer homology domain-containing protein [Desulfotomaculum sp.]
MIKRIISGTITLALSSALVFSPPALLPAGAASFNDLKSHWARQAVEQSYALDLMKGYPGDVFNPDGPISRLEAIAIIIRGMGLESQALSLDYKNSGVTLPKGMTWGQGHLVLATQKGLLHKDYVSQLMYNNPITRQEVAALVAVALQDKLKVKGDPAKLSFTDTDNISTTYRPYVADVSQNDIMQGQGNNEFGPNDIMRRGQMAALIVKTTVNGWFEYGSDRIIDGTLAGIDTATDMATVKKSDGTQIPRLVGSNTVYYRGTSETTKDDFRSGEKVLAIVGSDATIRYMEASSDTGNTGNSTNTGTTGNTGNTNNSGSGATITEQTQYTEGEVTVINSNYIAVKTGTGTVKGFSLSSNTKVLKSSSQVSIGTLKVGDLVKVTSVNGEAREIAITGTASLTSNEAEVRGVDDFYGFITLRDRNGNRKEYEVLVNARIEKGNDRVSLDELEIGDDITFEVGSNGKIDEIIALGSEVSSATGKVTDLRTGSTPRIYVDSDRYEVDKNADIIKDGDDIDLEDIMIGTEVTVKMDEDDIVTKIIVEDDEDIIVEGTVTEVDEDRDEITIEQGSDLEFTLEVNRSCTFRDTSSSSYDIEELDDIRDGWDVKLYLDNGKVKEIRVTDT